MAFIATPSDDEFRLELDILETLLREMVYTHVLNRGGRGVRSPADS